MKKCPFCAEKIKKNAKKCKHCGEWLPENTIYELEKRNTNQGVFLKKIGNIILNIIKYIGFFVASFLSISLFQIIIYLLIVLYSSISLGWIIFLLIILGGLFRILWRFLLIGIVYIMINLFKLCPNKKAGRIIFNILLILLTIDKLYGIRTTESPNIIKVIYVILIIILCIGLLLSNKEISESF